ncbi:hypothetical protein GCM10011581_13220 [Saccharopolyspora subtropica]|uniref:Secreted protein n=1 Tax=Saccharopolyspora thermophila TaxID=89367 RepID=A0A917N8R3_9PSEU|nr:hypothetical protein [Saccharopolyspora subtropica]GGI77509.1 hypothetical protein GCM10011581_13220 [Saccharopolyspora subtropica]
MHVRFVRVLAAGTGLAAVVLLGAATTAGAQGGAEAKPLLRVTGLLDGSSGSGQDGEGQDGTAHASVSSDGETKTVSSANSEGGATEQSAKKPSKQSADDD